MPETANDRLQVADLEKLIRAIPDFPKPGILFRDITPLLADPAGLASSIRLLARTVAADADCIASIDARGFILGAAAAVQLGLGFVPIRKSGKLPAEAHSEKYDLEYGSAELQIHADAAARGAKVWVIDDLIATGGSIKASCALIERTGATVAGISALIELEALEGRKKLDGYSLQTLIRY